MDDATRLLIAARDGDPVALRAWVRSTQAEVWRLCARLGDRIDADDLTQETYARAWAALPSFRGDASARTWLLSIARRVCADHVRRTQRRRRLDGLRPRRLAIGDPSEAVDLDDLVASLDDDRRVAFVLTQMLGLTYEEAAAVGGCPVGTIRSRVARARAELVAALGAGDAGGAAAP